MLSTIVLAAAAVWIFVLVLVVAVCRDAKAGDQAMEMVRTPSGPRDDEARVIELVVGQRDRDTRQLPRLA